MGDLNPPEASKMPASVLVTDSTIVELRLKQQAELPRIQALGSHQQYFQVMHLICG